MVHVSKRAILLSGYIQSIRPSGWKYPNKVTKDHMIKNPCNFRSINVKMARTMDRGVPLIIMIGVILLNSINDNSIQCKLCTGQFGVYYCTSVSTEWVRIFGTPTIREIKVFSCGVKIMRAVEWGGQDPIIRDRNNNICIGEYIFYKPPPLLWIGKSKATVGKTRTTWQ